MEKRIELKFDNTISRISGNPFGQRIYNEQVKSYIDDLTKSEVRYIIVFPPQIQYVGSSFVQGFIRDICMKIKKERFYEYFDIDGSDSLQKEFKEGLFDSWNGKQ